MGPIEGINVAIFTAKDMRGTGIGKQRRALLEAAAALGAIQYRTNLAGSAPRQATQYVVRIADRLAPWRVMDGKEIGPWLLGIAEARVSLGDDEDEAGPALLGLLATFMADADPVPAELAAAGA